MTWEWEYLIKILIAIICGGIIGAEREYTGKAAGLRTFIVVSLGACIFSVVSLEIAKISSGLFDNAVLRIDPGRIAAQIVVGIGFIGAGLIIFQEQKIKGLTTAAGLWLAAALGMSAGFGLYALAIMGTLAGIVALSSLRGVERFLDRRAENARQRRLRRGLEE